MSMTGFFTRQVAEEGIVLPLYRPGEDKESGEWIRIRGVDSDEFREAEVDSRRRLRELAGNPKADLSKAYRDELLLVVSSLVCGWSFPEPLTQENIIQLMREAPQIRDMVNQAATQRNLFFKNGSKSSENTPEPNSN